MTMIIIDLHKADDEGWKTDRPTPTPKLCEEEKDSFGTDSENIEQTFSEDQQISSEQLLSSSDQMSQGMIKQTQVPVNMLEVMASGEH